MPIQSSFVLEASMVFEVVDNFEPMLRIITTRFHDFASRIQWSEHHLRNVYGRKNVKVVIQSMHDGPSWNKFLCVLV